MLNSSTAEKCRPIDQGSNLTTSYEYSNRSSSPREYLNNSSTSGWNGFSQNFPSFVETLNFQQRNLQGFPESFESLMQNFNNENADETVRRINENTIMPKEETIYNVLLEKAILQPNLVDSVVEIFNKVLWNKSTSSSNLNCNTSSTVIKIIIVNKLEVLLESAGKELENTQLASIIKLIQKLYQNAIISKHSVNYIIDLIKNNENSNKFVHHYATKLETIVESKISQRKLEFNGHDKNNEMTSSGEWSDFDSETSRHGFLR